MHSNSNEHKVHFQVQFFFSEVSQNFSETYSVPNLSNLKVFILISWFHSPYLSLLPSFSSWFSPSLTSSCSSSGFPWSQSAIQFSIQLIWSYESTYLFFYRKRRRWNIILCYLYARRCRRCLWRNWLCKMVLQLSFQWRSFDVAGLFSGSYWYCFYAFYIPCVWGLLLVKKN